VAGSEEELSPGASCGGFCAMRSPANRPGTRLRVTRRKLTRGFSLASWGNGSDVEGTARPGTVRRTLPRDQLLETRHCPLRESRNRPGAELLLGGGLRRLHHAPDTACGERLDLLGPAPGEERVPQPLLAQLDRADFIGQPGRECRSSDTVISRKPNACRICPRWYSKVRPENR
jgi:hypothetical protein